MVREANVKQATAEKQLKEAQGKVSLGAFLMDGETVGRLVMSALTPLAAVVTGEAALMSYSEAAEPRVSTRHILHQ